MLEIQEPQPLKTRLVKLVLEQFLEDVSFELFDIPKFQGVLQGMFDNMLAFAVAATLESNEDLMDLNILAGSVVFEEGGEAKTIVFNATPSAEAWDGPQG